MSRSLFCTLALVALAVPSTVLAIPAPVTFDRHISGEPASVGRIADPRAAPIKILIGNDDGWAEANIRQLYADAQQAGNDVILSAPASNQSGRSSLDLSFGTVTNAEYGSIPDGSPQAGSNSTDSRLNYFNGTPVAAIKHGFNDLTKTLWGGAKPDIVLSGPNVGANLGAVTLFSGTVGVASFAAGQGVPAIAFSGGSNERKSFTALQPGDVSHLYSELAMTITNQVTSSAPFLPNDVILNVNFPNPPANCSSASDFKYIFTTVYPLVPRIGCTESITTPNEADVIRSGACLVSISAMGSNKLDVDTAKQTTVFSKLQPILSCADVEDHVVRAIFPIGLKKRDD